MKNLHLKNLKEFDLYEININKINKIESEMENKIYSLLNNTLDYLILQLEHIKLTNSTIEDFKNCYLNDIKKHKSSYLTRNNLQNIKEFLTKLEEIKNLTIGSTIDIYDYNYSIYYDDDIDNNVYEVDLMHTFLYDSAPGDILILEAEVVKGKIFNIMYHK